MTSHATLAARSATASLLSAIAKSDIQTSAKPLLRHDQGADIQVNQRKRKLSGGDENNEKLKGAQNGNAGENDADLLHSSPLAKRQKTVHFDMSLNMTSEISGRRTLDQVKKSVRRALETHTAVISIGSKADDQDYTDLVEVFANEREPYVEPLDGEDDEENVRPEDLVLYIVALTSCTPLLNKSCVTLIRKLLSCSWLGRDENFFRSYVQLLAALVSAQGAYMRPVLEMIVDKFKEPTASSWSVPDFPNIDRETAQRRLHFGLRHILQIFPAARPVLCKVISQKFPFPDESKAVHLFYVDNILRLREYTPSIGPDVLEMITSQLVKIDTEFQLDLSDMDDDLVAKVVFQLTSKDSGSATAMAADGTGDEDNDEDADSEVEESDMPAFGDPDYDEEVARIDKSTKLVQKLDAILDQLFALLTPIFDDPESDAARSCLEDMLSDFANFVLTVPSSRHTQFLVFHFSQKSLALQDIFTGTLLNLGFESNRPSAVRQAAAAYLSSYVARAARVPRETVRSVASILCHRIEMYRRRNGDGCRGPDLRRYQELYSWVQALLYIFCFRWRDLVDSYPEDLVDPENPATYVGHDLEWMPGLKQALTNIIHASFNPLMVCSPPIVAEFAKLAHSLRLMYVFPKLESNKKIHLSQFVSGRYGHGGALREDAGYTVDDDKRLQLEGNFPFDPYHLPTSKRWLEGDYVSWTPIPGVGGAGDDDDDDSDSDDDGGVNPLGADDEFEEDTATDAEEDI